MAGNGGGVSVGKGRHHRHKKIEYIQVHIMASKIKYMFLCFKRALSIGWQRLAELRIIRSYAHTLAQGKKKQNEEKAFFHTLYALTRVFHCCCIVMFHPTTYIYYHPNYA